jgi:hypothetical protein
MVTAFGAEASYHRCGDSDQGIREILHRGHDQIRLMRRHAKGSPPPIDEGCSHSRRFSADAIEGVIGDEEHLVHADSHDFRCFCVRCDMGLEGIGNRDRDNTVEGIPW